MKYVPRRESSATRKAKSSRSTEQGIAGHQAAMKAIKPSRRKPGIAGHGLVSTFPSGTSPKVPLTHENRLNNIANALEQL